MNTSKIIDKIIKFRDERDWNQFHTVKDLCLGLGIEIKELQELFLWKNEDEINEIKAGSKEKISDELADIFIFLAYLSKEFEIDLEQAVISKIQKNERKYPIDKAKGKNTKYDKL